LANFNNTKSSKNYSSNIQKPPNFTFDKPIVNDLGWHGTEANKTIGMDGSLEEDAGKTTRTEYSYSINRSRHTNWMKSDLKQYLTKEAYAINSKQMYNTRIMRKGKRPSVCTNRFILQLQETEQSWIKNWIHQLVVVESLENSVKKNVIICNHDKNTSYDEQQSNDLYK